MGSRYGHDREISVGRGVAKRVRQHTHTHTHTPSGEWVKAATESDRASTRVGVDVDRVVVVAAHLNTVGLEVREPKEASPSGTN
jgi:hypothetical protein